MCKQSNKKQNVCCRPTLPKDIVRFIFVIKCEKIGMF